jgi:pyridoxamine 5'-phosphate oxidase-like protein
MSAGQRHSTELTRGESLRLLASVSFGRIVFTLQALPAIRPVNHLLDHGDVIIRTHLGAPMVAAAGTELGVVVAYEADEIDPNEHLGWSVIVTGRAYLVRDPQQVARYERMLHTWVAGTMDQFIRIHPEIITGIRLNGI